MDLQSLLEYDRQLLLLFNGSNNLFADHWMSILTSGFTWIALYIALLILVIRNNASVSQILLIVGSSLLCVLLAGGVSDLIVKPLVGRLRPCNDPVLCNAVHVVKRCHASDFSFFSAHAANTFSIAVFFCWLVKSRLLGAGLVAWSLLNCYTRLYLGLHYPFDIVVGLAWGFLVGTGVWFLYLRVLKRLSPDNGVASSQYMPKGYNHTDVCVVLLVLVLILVYSILRALFFF